jgi:putative DNA primase/helicase
MKTLQACEGRWEEVYKLFGLRITGNRHIKCVFCDNKKMRVTDRGWICTCGNGNGIQYIIQSTGKEFREVADTIDKHLGNLFKANVAVSKADKIVEEWKGLKPLKGTCGEEYLKSRGIVVMPKRAMKVGKAYDYPTGLTFDALVCVATDSRGEPVYIHRTYLDGDKKADIEANKKKETVQEAYGSYAIKFFEPATCIGIAEGIETALSAHRLYQVNTWSTMDTSGMKRFRAPKGVKHLMIFADTDKNGAGHAAAFECANKNILCGNDVVKVTVRWPESGDFNDLLQVDRKVFEWEFNK